MRTLVCFAPSSSTKKATMAEEKDLTRRIFVQRSEGVEEVKAESSGLRRWHRARDTVNRGCSRNQVEVIQKGHRVSSAGFFINQRD
mmetsp:Transcript_15228/g.23270  ORF Transcript_15228/g.23270 Transcript_15228/m.23270 type:complete len:86 (+) Transcript_15228:153-410(+)